MSASLVGSEMCIRDSDGRGPSSVVAQGAAAKTRGPVSDFAAFPTSASAVSYTHLTLPTICSV
eukprot:3279731-Alexandrium_andersonii.AAC.1